MPTKCKCCGYIHWDEVPTLKEAFDEVEKKAVITSRELADRQGISIQLACNRLTQLEQLGAVDSRTRNHPTGGKEKVFVQSYGEPIGFP